MWITRITINDSEIPDDIYFEHQMMWNFFENYKKENKRPFLYRRDFINNRPVYIVVSDSKPVSPSKSWILETKLYNPNLEEGQQLAFTLRVNPTTDVNTKDGDKIKKSRRDVVSDAIQQKKYDGSNNEIIQLAVTDWLSNRQGGFELEKTCVDERQYVILDNKNIKFTSYNISGVLTVIEPEKFKQILFNGIGKSRAFGHGLVLVKRYV